MKHVYLTKKRVQGHGHISGRKKSDKTYIILSMLVISNMLYWIPLDVLQILALAGVNVSNDLSNWVAVFILPLGAATNPLFYTARLFFSKQEKVEKKIKKSLK